MPFSIGDLSAESIEDATAYWLYAEDEAWERWSLVPGSPIVSPNGRVLRMAFGMEGDRFELALVQRDDGLYVKFDEREDPEQELATRVFEASDEVIVVFEDPEETVFIHLEIGD